MNLEKYTNTLPRAGKEDRLAWRIEENRLRAMFEKDAELEFGFSELPEKAKQKIHEMAWSEGHACGYSEVMNCYPDLVELAMACRVP